jgi:hypothetical protein
VTDILASTSTTASITVGGIVTNLLEVAGDHDWFRITLTAGQSITISLSGSGATPVADTYLNLRDANGNILTHNDDSGGTLNSKIVFTATTSGTYYIDAGAWDTTSQPVPASSDTLTGGYTLSVQPYVPPPIATYDQIATQLVSGYWQAQGGQSGHHFNVTQGGTITVNYSTLTAAEQNLAITALQEWSDIIGVTFVPVTTGGQIRFDNTEDPSDPGPIAQTEWLNTYAHVQISSSWVSGRTGYGTSLNSYSFQTYIHEIGHALGLGHAGNYNGDADYAADALFRNDSWGTSIMSYFSESDNSYFASQGFSDDLTLTPMNADIVAMQMLYGLSTTTRTGNTTYGYNSNAGRDVFDATKMSNVAYTIFDSGGNDTLDYSGSSANQTINLNPETFFSVLGNTGNVMIARGTIIENAIGGSGSDTIIGNSVNNVITGGLGTDSLSGGAGNDTFRDTLAGLNGDTLVDFSAGDSIVVSNATLSTFTFNLTGTTLTMNGTVVYLGSAPGGTLVASAATGGGVQLSVGSANPQIRDVDNDFNGDGRSDILWRHDNGVVTDWLATASGGFTPNSANALNGVSTSWQVAGTGDFNGDGRDDIMWRNVDGRITNWLGTASGGFTDNAANALNGVTIDWQVAGIGDFNGDGRDDILWRNTDGRITDWLGTATGGYTPNAANFSTNVSTGWQVVATGDFNGDGRDDIMWRNVDGRITNWLGGSTGNFIDNVANAYNGVSLDWHVAGVGDFNGDGRDDILWRNDDGRITDWLSTANGGYAANTASFYTSLATAWQVMSIGDFNGDGRDDILFRNTDGRITDWLGTTTGAFTDNMSNSYTGVDTHWHVQEPNHLF